MFFCLHLVAINSNLLFYNTLKYGIFQRIGPVFKAIHLYICMYRYITNTALYLKWNVSFKIMTNNLSNFIMYFLPCISECESDVVATLRFFKTNFDF